MTATLVTGKIDKFILAIDPENSKGRKERIEFDDAEQMYQKCVELDRRDNAEYRPEPGNFPTERLYFTSYRRDDGTIVEQTGYSIAMRGHKFNKVGDAAYQSKCTGCGEVRWSEFPKDEVVRSYRPTGEHLCADCNKPDPDDYDGFDDFNNYDGSQEYED